MDLSCKKEEYIPLDTLRDVYVDMLLADQWIREDRSLPRVADTSYVYRPILRRHGISEEEFIKSVNFYMENPSGFAEMFDDVAEVLRNRKREIEVQERAEFIRDSIQQAREKTPFRRPDFMQIDIPDSVYARHMLMFEDSSGVFRFYPDSSSFLKKMEDPGSKDSLQEDGPLARKEILKSFRKVGNALLR